ncbi:MAG: lipopolysaccharide heptosyltransferase II [Thermodesulfobacteriota bacterium]|nr:lipopolysaccharide heptosyltransferase II [Thermodesulfobacteriota bacterium]
MGKQLQSIIVFCPNWVGDVVMATPVFDCLRQNYPGAEITAVIRNYAAGVIEDGPWFDRIIKISDKDIKGFLNAIGRLRSIKADTAIVLPNSFRSALITFLGGAEKIYGYKRNFRSVFFKDGPVPLQGKKGIKPVPMVTYYMEICRCLDLSVPVSPTPGLFFSEKIKNQGEDLFKHYGIKQGDMVIGINPGAKFGASKCWPPEYFATLAELIQEQWKCRILLFAGPGEDKIAQAVVDASRAEIINTGPDRISLSLLKYMIKNLDILITNDTGPRHYAIAFDRPVVVIMGPTDPEYTAACLEKTIVVRKENLPCSPCHEKTCPLGHHKCMTEILPMDILNACIRILENQKDQ